MKTQATEQAETPAENVIPLTPTRPMEKPSLTYREPFRLVPFINRAGSQSWRVSGMKRDGTRVRENFADLKRAECRKVALTTEWLARETETNIRATKLTDVQIRLAEACFMRLEQDHEISLAVDLWLKQGRENHVMESPRLDDAVTQFCTWLDTSDFRPRTRANLRTRVKVFGNSTANARIADITPDAVFTYLAKRDVAKASRDNDRRALSRFFAWCMDRPRQWIKINPARKETRERRGTNGHAPDVLALDACRKLLRAAERFENGRLAPYVAVCLFAGLRPTEAARLQWAAVNLKDGEIRLEGNQTKTGQSRVVAICPTLQAWLTAYNGQPFFPSNWRKDFDVIKRAAGYGGRVGDGKKLTPWPVDVMRHTAISHYFRQTGSYGRSSEQFGNSEAIIKRHYQGRVSSEDAKAFYSLLPKKGGRK
jgi:integrase